MSLQMYIIIPEKKNLLFIYSTHKTLSLSAVMINYLKMMNKAIVLSLLFLASFSAFSQNTAEKSKFGPRPDLKGDFSLSFGLNALQDNNVENFDTKVWGSNSFKIGYLYPVQLGNSHFSFHGGLNLAFEKYAFDNRYTLGYETDGETGVQTLVIDSIGSGIVGPNSAVTKSKFEANYLNLPVEFRWYLNKAKIDNGGFYIGAGANVGYLLDGKTKIKYVQNDEKKKIKREDKYELNQFRYGVHFKVGVGGFGAYFNYHLSELFNPGRGPQATETVPMTFGLSFNLF